MNTGLHVSFWIMLCSAGIYPGVGLQDLMVVLVFHGTSILFSIGAVPVYILTNRVGWWAGGGGQSVSYSVVSDAMNCSPPVSSVHGISQARILEWVAIPFSRGSSGPTDQTHVSHIVGGFFTLWATRELWVSKDGVRLRCCVLLRMCTLSLKKLLERIKPRSSIYRYFQAAAGNFSQNGASVLWLHFS